MSDRAASSEGAGVAATAMFVEVLVIGIGGLTVLGLGAAAILGPKPVQAAANLGSPADAAILLSGAYALGILVDRAADRLLHRAAAGLRSTMFDSDDDYGLARMKLTQVPAFAARAEYARSRLRVCRGWMLDGVGLTATGAAYVARFGPANQRVLLIILISACGLSFSACAFLTWRSIVGTGYRSLARQVQMIDQRPTDS
jgi:hypothetical protein